MIQEATFPRQAGSCRRTSARAQARRSRRRSKPSSNRPESGHPLQRQPSHRSLLDSTRSEIALKTSNLRSCPWEDLIGSVPWPGKDCKIAPTPTADGRIMNDFIANLPKAELHVHLEGTLEPELSFELAKKHGIELEYATVEDLLGAYDFHDLPSFLHIYYKAMSVLLDEDDFFQLT